MTTREQSIIEKEIRGLNVQVIWAIVLCTAITCSTVLSIYYGFKNEVAEHNYRINDIEKKLDRNNIR